MGENQARPGRAAAAASLTPEEHDRAFAIYMAAVDLPATDRTSFVGRESGGNEALADLVSRMLLHSPIGGTSMGTAALRPVTGGGQPDDVAPLPEWIGSFKPVARLGRGGMGEVFQAWQPSLERMVALKIIRAGRIGPDFVRRFQREGAAMAKIDHECVARVYEAGVDERGPAPQPYIAMEYVVGPPLDEYAESLGKLPAVGGRAFRHALRHRLVLMARICDGVQAAHDEGVVHCDLKPSNILIRSDSRKDAVTPKVVDFGVAHLGAAGRKETEAGPAAAVPVGTPAYMSPEMASGELTAPDGRCDVFALGVILHELLTGRLPFDLRPGSFADIARQLRAEAPRPLSASDVRLAGDLEWIVTRALELDPRKRYARAGALAEDIDNALSHRPVNAFPAGTSARSLMAYRSWKFARRSWKMLAAVALLIAFATIQFHTARVANTNLQRAEAAEVGLRRELADAHVRSARLAAIRGNWQESVAELAAAMDSGHPDPASLHVELARTLFCAGDHAAARKALEAVMSGTLAPEVEAERKLIDGLVCWHEEGRHALALPLIKEAADSEQLSIADQAYANGLLSDRGDIALKQFSAATRADSFHFLAWQALLVTQLLLGRHSEVSVTGRLVLAKFPDDPTACSYLALAAMLRGDEAERRRYLSEYGRRLTPAHAERLETLLDALSALRRVFSLEVFLSPAAAIAVVADGAIAAAKASHLDQVNPEMLFANTSTDIPFIRKSWGSFFENGGSILLSSHDVRAKAIDEVCRACPSSFFFMLRGVTEVSAADENARLEEKIFGEALESEAFMPEVARVAAIGLVRARHRIHQLEPSAATRSAVVEALDALVPKWNDLPNGILDLCATIALDVQELDISRYFLRRWEQRSPDDRQMLERRLQVEVAAHAWRPALAITDHMLSLEPDSAASAKWRRQILAAIAAEESPPSVPAHAGE